MQNWNCRSWQSCWFMRQRRSQDRASLLSCNMNVWFCETRLCPWRNHMLGTMPDRTTLIYIMDQRIVEIVLYTSLSVSRVSIMLLTGSCWVQFLARPPRNGQISLEKMDLINTVNQLLLEMNKLKSEKTSLQEEPKMHGHTPVCFHIKGTVTAPPCSPDCQ